MKTKINFRKILILTAWTLSGIGMITLLGFVSHEQEILKCSGVMVEMKGDQGHEFIDKEEVLALVNSKGKMEGKPIGTINTALLEKRILSNPFVESVEVYSSIGGKLHIDLVQRNPIVRIVNKNDEQFYIDQTGTFMPVSDRYTPPALVANGYIFNTYTEMKVGINTTPEDTTLTQIPRSIEQVYALAGFIAADTFWAANAEQIYVNEKQELELIPRFGNHRILIGDTTGLKDKFERLMVFYQDGLSKTGWNNYNLINLKYKGQVVCTKIK
ncbi:MAG: FtsQ-type POTRA domain-containing protein [Bacteroidetes bacterium]|nr:FtsQ-type POTRA domain-containing protein [Bacteroidota bacterium]